MPDIDDVLQRAPGAVARSAADAAEVPDFSSIVKHGRRHRAVRHGAIGGGAVMTVLLIVGLVQLGTPGQPVTPDPAPPSPSQTPTRSEDQGRTPDGSRSDPAAVIDRGIVQHVAATPGEEQSRAVVYSQRDRGAVTVTADDFATRRDLAVPRGTAVVASNDGKFLIVEGWAGRRIRIVDDSDLDEEVAVAGEPSPVAAGEIPVAVDRPGGIRLVAVDIDAATAHPVSLPVAVEPHHLVRVAGHRLMALTDAEEGATYHWSDDGGATWQAAVVRGGPNSLYEPVPTPVGGPHVLVEGGDGATLFPLGAVHRMPGGGATFDRVEFDDGGVFTSVASPYLWRDELRMFVTRGARQPIEAGIFRFASGEIDGIDTDRPDLVDRPVVDLVGTGSGLDPDLWLAGPHDALYRSVDGGETWEEVPGR